MPIFFSRDRSLSGTDGRASSALDLSGALVACLCACHCAVVPLLLVTTPVLAGWVADERIETFFLGAALVIGMLAFARGPRRTHRSLRPAAVFVLGFAALVAGRILEAGPGLAGVAVMVGGSCLIAVAHLDNLRLLRRMRRAGAPPCCSHTVDSSGIPVAGSCSARGVVEEAETASVR